MKPVRMHISYWDTKPALRETFGSIPCWDVFRVMDWPSKDPDWQWLTSFPTLPEAMNWARDYCEGYRGESGS